MKQRNIVIALLLGLLVILGSAAAVGPNTAIFRAILVQNDAAIGNDLAVGNNITADGAMDIAGNPSYGSRDLRPVGNPSNGKVYVIGVTSAKVQSATVVPTVQMISTVTAFGCGPDDAAFAGAWDCRAAMGSTNNITFTLYEVDATPVPTAAYDEIRYWVAGN